MDNYFANDMINDMMVETLDTVEIPMNPYTVTDKDDVIKIYRELNLEISTDMAGKFIYGSMACDNTFQSSLYPHADAIILWLSLIHISEPTRP